MCLEPKRNALGQAQRALQQLQGTSGKAKSAAPPGERFKLPDAFVFRRSERQSAASPLFSQAPFFTTKIHLTIHEIHIECHALVRVSTSLLKGGLPWPFEMSITSNVSGNEGGVLIGVAADLMLTLSTGANLLLEANISSCFIGTLGPGGGVLNHPLCKCHYLLGCLHH